MRNQVILWVVAAAVVGAAIFALGGLLGRAPAASAPQGPPEYSLSSGGGGMISGGASYYYDFLPPDAVPTEEIVTTIENYLRQQDNSDLVLSRLLEFDLAYQAEIVEGSTGRQAFGLMVSPTGLSPKAGPNIFWNLKYGSMIAQVGGGYGMLGRLLPQSSGNDMTVTAAEARTIAEEAVQSLDPSLELDETTRAFYGFYGFTVLREGAPVGELDINGYSGQVWFNDWGRTPVSVQTVTSEQ